MSPVSALPRHVRAALRPLALACCALAGGVAVLHAAVFVPEYPYRAKEFDIVREGSLFHVFYIRDKLFTPYDSTTVEFGHATSVNLTTWEEHDPVLHVRTDKWDNSHVWAPSIVRKDGLWYLFYTGVTTVAGQYAATQRIGVATSPDLWNWTRFDQPLWTCQQTSWTWCDFLLPSGGEFRDPCVIPHPTVPGGYLMYYAARTARAHDQMAVGVAQSAGNLFAWSDIGALWNTATNHHGSELVESPEIVEHNGLWYLFFTTNSAKALAFETAASPLADSSAWSPVMRLKDELPEETWVNAWFGVEFYSNLGHDYLLAANSLNRSIEVREVRWEDPPHFSVREPTVTDPNADVPPGAWRLALARVPAGGGGVRLRVTLPAEMRARLELHDVQGRRVRTLLAATLAAGPTEVEWDGRDDTGTATSHGVYFAALRTPAGRRVVRIPFVR